MVGGGLYSFGKNDHGQLGLQGGESRLVPVSRFTMFPARYIIRRRPFFSWTRGWRKTSTCSAGTLFFFHTVFFLPCGYAEITISSELCAR